MSAATALAASAQLKATTERAIRRRLTVWMPSLAR